MVYLVRLKMGYNEFFYSFEYFENAVAFIERLKHSLVKELSDDLNIKIIIEALTKDEFNEKIEEAKGD